MENCIFCTCIRTQITKRQKENSPGSITLSANTDLLVIPVGTVPFEITSGARAYVRINCKKLREIPRHRHNL